MTKPYKSVVSNDSVYALHVSQIHCQMQDTISFKYSCDCVWMVCSCEFRFNKLLQNFELHSNPMFLAYTHNLTLIMEVSEIKHDLSYQENWRQTFIILDFLLSQTIIFFVFKPRRKKNVKRVSFVSIQIDQSKFTQWLNDFIFFLFSNTNN